MTDTAEMPKYKCHKEVHALKIERVVRQIHPEKDDVEFRFIDEGFAPIIIEAPEGMRIRQALLNKHKEGEPLDTGYLVVYEDGYRSWSPTKAFEDGYTKSSESQQVKLIQKMEWIRNDIAYKAPEQLSVQMFAEYLDMIGDVVAQNE